MSHLSLAIAIIALLLSFHWSGGLHLWMVLKHNLLTFKTHTAALKGKKGMLWFCESENEPFKFLFTSRYWIMHKFLQWYIMNERAYIYWMSIKCQTLVIKFIYSILCSPFKGAGKQRTSPSKGLTDRGSERLTFRRLYLGSNQIVPPWYFIPVVWKLLH